MWILRMFETGAQKLVAVSMKRSHDLFWNMNVQRASNFQQSCTFSMFVLYICTHVWLEIQI